MPSEAWNRCGGYDRDMPYLLAAAAVAAPIFLVVQTIRGRVRMQSCCSVPADRDRRLSADRA